MCGKAAHNLLRQRLLPCITLNIMVKIKISAISEIRGLYYTFPNKHIVSIVGELLPPVFSIVTAKDCAPFTDRIF